MIFRKETSHLKQIPAPIIVIISDHIQPK